MPPRNRNRICKKCSLAFRVRWNASPQRFCSRVCAKEETYLKVSLTQKGRPSPLKGISRPADIVEKIRQSNLGLKRSIESRLKMRLAKLGRPSLKRGVPLTAETKRRMSIALKGRICPNKGKKSSYAGSKHHNWRGGITPLNEKLRKSHRYREWRSHVFQRDDYTCQSCKARGVELHADHVLPFAQYTDLRFEILNGRTLCVPCHRRTPTYGHLTPPTITHS